MSSPNQVFLLPAQDYEQASLRDTVFRLLEAACPPISPGLRVLVKPNLLTVKNARLSTTDPRVVKAACEYLLDQGARVSVGDSPAFGTAKKVAARNGLSDALTGLPVNLVNFTGSVPLRLASGHKIDLSRQALECDLMVNAPKLKAHCQMRVSLAVKNTFGCVTGVRKAFAHARFGDKSNLFESMILDVHDALPPKVSLLDAVDCMHQTGPSGGTKYRLGLLAASQNTVALDTCLYLMLGLSPKEVPLWNEAIRRGLPGSGTEDIEYPMHKPQDFDASGFVIPHNLDNVSFHPLRMVKSICRRALARVKK